jgi:hypothetical protein
MDQHIRGNVGGGGAAKMYAAGAAPYVTAFAGPFALLPSSAPAPPAVVISSADFPHLLQQLQNKLTAEAVACFSYYRNMV